MRHERSKEIHRSCANIAQIVAELDFFNLQKADIDRLRSFVDDILATLHREIDKHDQSEDKEVRSETIYQLYHRQILADEFRNYLTSTPVQSAVSPYIILTGDGGVGKSHLIADYIEERTSVGQSSLLLLGQSISKNLDFLSSLPGLIGYPAAYHEFFDALEKIAVSQQSRFLICIDALNEGPGIE